ncbi:RNA polymerase sigma factor [Planctomycetes bacterium K23_9]|uniref:RNA polymerase sigma factor n=1 Tax=Stieleria marina TaxID=1930275 RepID=A0A517P1A9_9BACT|nr:hypothetical protein K239x_51620 [Planctomycetes bacterium K23_9]
MSPQKSSTDKDASSSSDSLDVLWREFGSQLRRRARTRLRQYGLTGQTESMDICNDVMVDLARRQKKSPAGGTALDANVVLGYIMRAIDNQVLDTFRTLARQCRDFRRNDALPVDEMPMATTATTPSQVAIRKEVMSRIRVLLGPEDARIVDLMLENRDWQEIGKILDLRPDTARMRVRRALDRIRGDIGLTDSSLNDEQAESPRLGQDEA